MNILVRLLLRVIVVAVLAFGVFALYWWVVQPVMRKVLLDGISP